MSAANSVTSGVHLRGLTIEWQIRQATRRANPAVGARIAWPVDRAVARLDDQSTDLESHLATLAWGLSPSAPQAESPLEHTHA